MPKSSNILSNQKEKNKELENLNDITFAPHKWLNDKEVELALEKIKKKSPKKHGFVSVYDWPLVKVMTDFDAMARLFSQLADNDKELVFIPVNNPDTHWSLLVYETKTNKFYHLDSSRQKLNEQYVKDVVNHLCQHKNAAFEDVNNRPLQPNSNDCGVYLLGFARLLSEKPELLRSNLPEVDSETERGYWRNEVSKIADERDKVVEGEIKDVISRNNVICDQCQKQIGDDKLAYFSDVEKNLDFCSEDCYSSWTKEGNWENIHPDFTFELKKWWKWLKFSVAECKEWIDIGLQPSDVGYAWWLRDTKQKDSDWVLNEGNDKLLRKEYETYLKQTRISAQEWLDENYPLADRAKIVKLDVSKKGLKGCLNFNGFNNLKWLNCSNNQLSSLDVSSLENLVGLCSLENQLTCLKIDNCTNLAYLICSHNLLMELDLTKLNSDKLIMLHIESNNFPSQDLSIFSRLINLEELGIGTHEEKRIKNGVYNHFYGSLELLKCLTNLKSLSIENTDVSNGLDYLPRSVKEIYCSFTTRPESKVKEIVEKLNASELFDNKGDKYVRRQNSQEWLEKNYPIDFVCKRIEDKENYGKQRWQIINLDISNQNLTGDLDLTNFDVLEELNITGNQYLEEVKNIRPWTVLKITKTQEWLGRFFPKESTKQMIFSSIYAYFEIEEMIISDYPVLEEIETFGEIKSIIKVTISNCPLLQKINISNFSDNEELKIINCPKTKNINCFNNRLISLEFLNNLINPKELTNINLSNNNLPQLDLTTFGKLFNLRELQIGNNSQKKINQEIYNRFIGSLKLLKNCSRLEFLDISNTNINQGVEYLPNSLTGNNRRGCKKINYSIKERPTSKVQEITQRLDLFTKEYQKWVNLGFSFKEMEKWLEAGFFPDDENCAQKWKKRDFTAEEAKLWKKAGLKNNDYVFAFYLKKEKKLSTQEVENRLSELIEEYNLPWKDVHRDFRFTIDLQQKWEESGFDSQQTKIWIEVGLNSEDYNYASWLEKRETSSVSMPGGFPLNAVEWHLKYGNQLRREHKRLNNKYGLCPKCYEPYSEEGNFFNFVYGTNLCSHCNIQYLQKNFSEWTSGNPDIDKFIQSQQLSVSVHKYTLLWIDYNKITDIEYLATGGFSTVYKAKYNIEFRKAGWWIKMLTKNTKVKVALKSLHDSRNLTTDFLQEIVNNELLNCQESMTVPCYGISRNPQTGDYLIVMKYMENGNLRQYLRDNSDGGFFKSISLAQHSFEKKMFKKMMFDLVYKSEIIRKVAEGLESIHEKGLIHKDFHPGNILNNKMLGFLPELCLISDLGLSKPVDERDNNKVYGVLPYVAPEVLTSQPYTQTSDVYSWGMIAYEVLTGLPPYHNIPHDLDLAFKICEGLRPNLNNIIVPQMLKDLIKQCWDTDPLARPTASEMSKNLSDWKDATSDRGSEFNHQSTLAILSFWRSYLITINWRLKGNDSLNSLDQHCSQAVYHSRLLDFPNLPEPQNNSSQEWQTSTLLGLQIKAIEEEIKLLKESLNNEQSNLFERFIQVNKKTIKNKEDKQVRNEAGELEEKLQEKGFVTKDIEKIIKYCERLVVLEQQTKQVELQTQIEVTTKK